MSQRRKTPEKTETTKDEVMKWNEYYCRNKFGIGVECTKCHKWRKVFDYSDLYEVPEDWECKMSKFDGKKGNCKIPSTLNENSFVEDKYVPGTVVWAKYKHYSWWPGMVEDDPDTQLYHMVDEDRYNVTFFGKNVSRGWVKGSNLKFFVESFTFSQPRKSAVKIDLDIAKKQAEEAIKMTLKERFQHYSFVMLYKKKFPKAKKFDEIRPVVPDPKIGKPAVEDVNSTSTQNAIHEQNGDSSSHSDNQKRRKSDQAGNPNAPKRRTNSASEWSQTAAKTSSKRKNQGADLVPDFVEKINLNVPEPKKAKLDEGMETDKDSNTKELAPAAADILPTKEQPPINNDSRPTNDENKTSPVPITVEHFEQDSLLLSDSNDNLSNASSSFNFNCSTRATNGNSTHYSSDEDIFGDDELSEDFMTSSVKNQTSFNCDLPFLTPALPDMSGKRSLEDVDPVPSQFILGELVIDPNNPKYQTYKYYPRQPQM